MGFASGQIVDELQHLLIGQYRRAMQRRGSRVDGEFTTAFACPETNRQFEALSGVGPEWTREDSRVSGFATLIGRVTLRRRVQVDGTARLEGMILLDHAAHISRGHLFGQLTIG